MPKITSRDSAFEQPYPEGWQPQAGERVFLAKGYRRKTAIVKFLDGELGRAIFNGTGKHDIAIKRKDVRPMSKHQANVWGSHKKEDEDAKFSNQATI